MIRRKSASSDKPDVPPLNMTPMIDVVFQLLIFFMCTIRFRTMEGKLLSYLPKDKGLRNVAFQPLVEEVRITLKYDESTGVVSMWLGQTQYPNHDALMNAVHAKYEEFKRTVSRPVPVIIDADKNVPYREVVKILDMCAGRGIKGCEFALPPVAPPKK